MLNIRFLQENTSHLFNMPRSSMSRTSSAAASIERASLGSSLRNTAPVSGGTHTPGFPNNGLHVLLLQRDAKTFRQSPLAGNAGSFHARDAAVPEYPLSSAPAYVPSHSQNHFPCGLPRKEALVKHEILTDSGMTVFFLYLRRFFLDIRLQ